TPLVKAWCTDMSLDVTSTGVQVHGGMGFIEETGAAQYYRDARILPIYEGTNGIQAADLVFRKILRDGGAILTAALKEGGGYIAQVQGAKADDLETIGSLLEETHVHAAKASGTIGALSKEGLEYVASVSVPYLNGLATLAAGVMMGRSAVAAQSLMQSGV